MTPEIKNSIKQDIDRLLEITLCKTKTYYECELRHMLEFISSNWEEITNTPKEQYWLTVFYGGKASNYAWDHQGDELKDILRGLREIDKKDHLGAYEVFCFDSKEDREQAKQILASAECYDSRNFYDERDAKYV